MSRQAALVTGSSRGIGLGAAIGLAKEGFAVAINGRKPDEVAAAVEQVKAHGVDACAAPFDVADLSAHDGILEQVESEIGPLTTLVNNAGVGVMERGDPLNVSEASWDRCLDVNAKSMFFLTQAFAKRLLSRERSDDLYYSVINVTSSNAVAVAEPRLEYCASKASAAMVSKGWAVRLGREDIAVFDVQPGLIATDMTAAVIAQYEERAKAGLTLMPRVGQPEDMGMVVASLAAGRMPYMTGQALSADGGLLVPRF